jgi:hypothetical protein
MTTVDINYYRLGDLVYNNYLNEEEEDKILTHHPSSLGSKFIIEKRKNNKDYINDTNFRLLIFIKLLLEYIIINQNKFPRDIIKSLIIHLRLGDVVAGTIWYEKGRRPFSIEHLSNLINNYENNDNESKNEKRYLIGKCHFGKDCSTNYEECLEISNKYLNECLQELKAEHLKGEDADFDLCCAILSNNFLQGRGCYSSMIVAIRRRLKLKFINNPDYQNIIEENIDNFNKIENIYKYSFQSLENQLNLIKKIFFNYEEKQEDDNINDIDTNTNIYYDIKPSILYITNEETNNQELKEFIDYYFNIGFEYIYIYLINNDKIKLNLLNYNELYIYIIPNNLSYSNNSINQEILNNYKTIIFKKKNVSTDYLYINDDNKKEIKNYLISNNHKNIKKYINDKNLNFCH